MRRAVVVALIMLCAVFIPSRLTRPAHVQPGDPVLSGRTVTVEHDNGYVTVYMHVGAETVNLPAHLHFQIAAVDHPGVDFPVPQLTSISPTSAPGSGATLTVTGSNFQAKLNVMVSFGTPGTWALEVTNPDGRVAVNIPSEMTIGRTETIAVRLSLDKVQDLSRALLGRGHVREFNAALASAMAVRLDGDSDFKIVPLVAEEQVVARAGYTEWLFRVTPTDSGARSVKLFLRADLSPSSPRPLYREILALDHIVRVAPNLPFTVAEFVKNNWVTLLGLPMLAWVLKAKNALFSRRGHRIGFLT
jgi:IPT/TIG domain-containing protein